MGPFGEAAKEYRKAGWRGTLPLPPRAKEEPPTGYTGHGSPYPSEKDVRVWLSTMADGNICLRLAGVDERYITRTLPQIYGGNNVDGWELIGIDVDDYGEKHGFEQLLALEQQLGPLPATVVSSARWAENAKSGTRIFLVPKGFRYKGKAAATGHEGPKHIDVLYAGLRYLVVWPSVHPTGLTYEFRHGDSEGIAGNYDGLAPLDDVAVLPVEWFRHLLAGAGSDADAKSDLDFGELNDWAMETFRDPEGEPCRLMANEVAKYIDELDDSDSHHPLNDVVWRVTLNAMEGHSGWYTALNDFIGAWIDSVKGKRDLEEAQGEVLRTIDGALAKAKAKFDERDGFLADDKCDGGAGDPDAWADKFDRETEALVAERDNDGMGPVVGKMELGPGKPADEYGQHDHGNAQHFVDVVGDNVKYVDGRNGWVVWDGERWHRDLNGRYVRLAYSTVRKHQEAFAARCMAEGVANDDGALKKKATSWFGHAKQSGNLPSIKRALESAEALWVGDEPVALPMTKFDDDGTLLGCLNGVLELTDTPDVRPPRKEDYVSFNTNVPYVPWRSLANAEGEMFEGFELWLEYLDTFLPDKRVQNYVQQALGHIIVGENPEKYLIFLYGPHDTGKSTMLHAIAGALGDYYADEDMSLFKQKDLNPRLIQAVPKRIIGMSEVDEGKMDRAKIKSLTGNDAVSAEAKYSNEIFHGMPQFSVVIATNNPPNIDHADEALNERILPLPFVHTIERSSRRYDRQKQIERHSGVAVLSWLVEGWRLYCANGNKLPEAPPAVKKMRRELISGFNTVQAFMSEELERWRDTEAGARARRRAEEKGLERGHPVPLVSDWEVVWTPPSLHVYRKYVAWCQLNNVSAVSHPELSKELGLGKPQPRKIKGEVSRCYVGVRIKDSVETTSSGAKLK